MNKTRTHSVPAQAAAAIRKELKTAGIKPASVKSRSFSMGSSVDVYLPADATDEQYEAARRLVCKYQYGSFDGMQDLYEYGNCRDDLPQVKYALVHREWRAAA